MKKSRSLKFTLLATAIISFAAGAAVCIGTALGSLSENFLLQEFSSLIMEMLFIFVIWVLLTSSTNTVLRQTYWIYSLRPNLHRFDMCCRYCSSQAPSVRICISCWNWFVTDFLTDLYCSFCYIQTQLYLSCVNERDKETEKENSEIHCY